MRDPRRIKRICNKLCKIWSRHKDYRFYQMLINECLMPDNRMWNIEDKDLEDALDKILKEVKDGKH